MTVEVMPRTVGIVANHPNHGVVGGVLYQRGQVDLVGVLVARRPRPLLRRCGAMASARIEDGELWRLVSSGFLHIDGLHLLLNALFKARIAYQHNALPLGASDLANPDDGQVSFMAGVVF